jgi:phosphatidyl-myo-inositol dimannoside synthase
MHKHKVLFLVLTAFSSMGGIEKFNRAFMKAFVQLTSKMSVQFSSAGLYDVASNDAYIPAGQFKAFSGNKIYFVIAGICKSLFRNELILGHINLALIGVIYKFLRPERKLTIICHGIEVFEEQKGLKKKVLQVADSLLAVSNFTKQQLISIQRVDEKKITVFPNTIDPYFPMPAEFVKPSYLQKRYGLHANENILFTLTRINSEEGYKGYDKIIRILPGLKCKGVEFKYILGGKADAVEEEKVKQLVRDYQLEDHVILTGFIPDEEVTDHYLLADAFVMPSKGEGFGIVFLEAMACGLQVIAGNKDGSTEALQFGTLGTLVDPDDLQQIEQAVQQALSNKPSQHLTQENMLQYFSFDHFCNRLEHLVQKNTAA